MVLHAIGLHTLPLLDALHHKVHIAPIVPTHQRRKQILLAEQLLTSEMCIEDILIAAVD